MCCDSLRLFYKICKLKFYHEGLTYAVDLVRLGYFNFTIFATMVRTLSLSMKFNLLAVAACYFCWRLPASLSLSLPSHPMYTKSVLQYIKREPGIYYIFFPNESLAAFFWGFFCQRKSQNFCHTVRTVKRVCIVSTWQSRLLVPTNLINVWVVEIHFEYIVIGG